MFEQIEIMRMARDMAVHAAARQSVVAQNVANADTPGYRARDTLSFADSYRSAGDTPGLRTTRAGHVEDTTTTGTRLHAFVSDEEPAPNGNSVSLEAELVKSSSAKRQHDISLAIYKSSLDLFRTALGRGR